MTSQSRPSPRRQALAVAVLVLAASAVVLVQGRRPAPLLPPPAPAGNPVTTAKVNLGTALFWDEQLSSTRTVACGTCHRPEKGGTDPRALGNPAGALNPGPDGRFGTADDVTGAAGVPANVEDGTYRLSPYFGMAPQVTGRRAPSVIDAAYARRLFGDGRAGDTFRDPIGGAVALQGGAALESQVLEPPVAAVEMAHAGRNWAEVAARVASVRPLALAASVPGPLAAWLAGRGYPALFAEAFGSTEVTPVRIAMAIASYERTLYSDQAPIDRFLAGDDTALTPEEQRGFQVFGGAGDCARCHAGGVFSDDRFHYLGVRPADEDPGRGRVTGDARDNGAFRTPSLRNVELKAPYFHTGRFTSLEAVVDFYNRGGDFDRQNNDIRPLRLSPRDRADLLAFLRRPLTDPRVASASGPFARPRLFGEAGWLPVIVDGGTSGSGGLVPAAVAVEPPVLGNPSFTVGISGGLGGAQARLVLDTAVPPRGAVPAGRYQFTTTLAGTGAGAGFGSAVVALPGDAGLAGAQVYGRWYVADPGAPGGIAASPAFGMVLRAPR
ncbi:MAG: cytochrome-c peroxidase [Vicinamibacterales bacterium]